MRGNGRRPERALTAEQSALALFEDAMLFTYSAALRAVAALGVADHLAAGPGTPDELAAACGTRADALCRTLRLLAGRDVFREDEAGRFHLTAKGDALRTASDLPARSAILMFTDRMFWSTAHELTKVARDPDPSFDDVFGMPREQYFESAERASLFYDGMAAVSNAEAPLIAQSYAFPSPATVVDVGGRSGSFLAAILRRNPRLEGVMFDLYPAPAGAPLDVSDLTDRWRTVQGDFFVEVPRGDVYVLKRILHNWDDDDCVRILANCRRAAAPGGRVLVIDAVIPDGNAAHQSKAMDLMMLAALTGRERTAHELRRLFDAAHLRLVRVIATPTVMSIAEGVVR